ncbi:MAG: hypothetical protein QXQ39_07110 [Conexivisphaerales archaeon]
MFTPTSLALCSKSLGWRAENPAIDSVDSAHEAEDPLCRYKMQHAPQDVLRRLEESQVADIRPAGEEEEACQVGVFKKSVYNYARSVIEQFNGGIKAFSGLRKFDRLSQRCVRLVHLTCIVVYLSVLR